MFYDQVTLELFAGRGGDGSASFRREAHVPRGGVDGGDGGDGGDIYLHADRSLRDLASLRQRRRYKAGDGGAGGRKRQHGKRGADVTIKVPVGTEALGEDGRRIADLTTDGDVVLVARGGEGGRGNTHFVSSVKRAPAFAEIGLPGEQMQLDLRLKLMADAALVGMPNAGKSSLLRRLSNARPKVGDYPFTTLAPVLGTVVRGDGTQLVLVDVPGLLERASEGHGLGHQFLPHLERAHLLVHTVSCEDPDTMQERFTVINRELWAYDPRIAQLPQLVALTKRDLIDDEQVERLTALVHEAADRQRESVDLRGVHAVSAVTGQGLVALVQQLFDEAQADAQAEHSGVTSQRPLEEYRVYRPQPRRRQWRIYKEKEGFRITGGDPLPQLAEEALLDLEAAERLWSWLQEHGAARALELAGAREGTQVIVCGARLEM